MGVRPGGCLCGDVRFEIRSEPTETGACHCGMCRKFTGGVFLGVAVAKDDLILIETKGLKVYASSAWAERGFCGTCGSSLFYRVTAPGPMQDSYHVGLGAMDTPDGIALTEEIFIDRKPSGYGFAQDTHKMTEAEVMAMFAPPE